MALAKLTSSDAGAIAREKINAAITALDQAFAGAAAEADTRFNADRVIEQGLAAEGQARSAGISTLESTLSRQLAGEANSRFQADRVIEGGLAAEGRARFEADAALGVRVNNLGEDLGRGLADLRAALISSVSGETAARIKAAAASLTRPGDGPTSFTARRVTGSSDGLPPLPEALIDIGDNGTVARTVGRGVIAMRQEVAIEYGRVYRARFVVRRRSDPADPSNHTVRCAIACLDQARNQIPGTQGDLIVKDIRDLRRSDGRQEVTVTLGRAGVASAALKVPVGTVYVRGYVQGYGEDGVWDVELISITDITELGLLPPISAEAVSRISALESLLLDVRLSAVESATQNPNSLTFGTKGDAVGASIPVSVTSLVLRGQSRVGDGYGALYLRTTQAAASAALAEASFRTADGAYWLRVDASIHGNDLSADAITSAGVGVTRAMIPTIRVGASSFKTSGFRVPGDAGQGATYVRGTADGLMAIRDAAGTWYNLVPESPLNLAHFGATLVQDAPSFTAALNAALAYVAAAGGGDIVIPRPRVRLPYLLDPLTIVNGTSKTFYGRLKGQGWNTEIQPARTCPVLIDIHVSLFDLEDFLISDPQGLITDTAIRTHKPVQDNLPVRIRRVGGILCKTFIVNDNADNNGMEDIFTLGCGISFENRKGGVGGYIDGICTQGDKYSIIIDAGIDFDANGVRTGVHQAEGFSIDRAVLLPTKANNIGIWIKCALLLHLSRIVVGQNGPGGIGMFLDGTGEGKAITLVYGDLLWFEAGANGNVIRSRGNVSNCEFTKTVIESVGRANIVGLDLQDCARMRFQGRTVSMTGAAAILKMYDSQIDFDFSGSVGGIVEDPASTIYWLNDDRMGIPNPRSPKSSFPRASREIRAVVPRSSVGTITPDTCQIRLRRDGLEVDLGASLRLVKNNDGAGFLLMPLPYPTQYEIMMPVRNKKTGRIAQAFAAAGDTNLIIADMNGAYPGEDGAAFVLSGRYQMVPGY